jgi:hypothetical protein
LNQTGAEAGGVQRRFPQQRAEQAKHLTQQIGSKPFRKRSWAELGFYPLQLRC